MPCCPTCQRLLSTETDNPPPLGGRPAVVLPSGMFDHLKAEVYGEKMPLKNIGTSSVRDAHLLAITVFDPTVGMAAQGGEGLYCFMGYCACRQRKNGTDLLRARGGVWVAFIVGSSV